MRSKEHEDVVEDETTVIHSSSIELVLLVCISTQITTLDENPPSSDDAAQVIGGRVKRDVVPDNKIGFYADDRDAESAKSDPENQLPK